MTLFKSSQSNTYNTKKNEREEKKSHPPPYQMDMAEYEGYFFLKR